MARETIRHAPVEMSYTLRERHGTRSAEGAILHDGVGVQA
jgi:hypothetical protein